MHALGKSRFADRKIRKSGSSAGQATTGTAVRDFWSHLNPETQIVLGSLGLGRLAAYQDVPRKPFVLSARRLPENTR